MSKTFSMSTNKAEQYCFWRLWFFLLFCRFYMVARFSLKSNWWSGINIFNFFFLQLFSFYLMRTIFLINFIHSYTYILIYIYFVWFWWHNDLSFQILQSDIVMMALYIIILYLKILRLFFRLLSYIPKFY